MNRGRPSNGLTKVLFVRVDEELLREIDEGLKAWRKECRGAALSRADFVRRALALVIEQQRAARAEQDEVQS